MRRVLWFQNKSGGIGIGDPTAEDLVDEMRLGIRRYQAAAIMCDPVTMQLLDIHAILRRITTHVMEFEGEPVPAIDGTPILIQ